MSVVCVCVFLVRRVKKDIFVGTVCSVFDPKKLAQAIFRRYDQDGNGTLDATEFVGVCPFFGPQVCTERCPDSRRRRRERGGLPALRNFLMWERAERRSQTAPLSFSYKTIGPCLGPYPTECGKPLPKNRTFFQRSGNGGNLIAFFFVCAMQSPFP